MEQWGFYFDQSRCVGCYACIMACKFKNHSEPDVFWRRMVWTEKNGSDVFVPLSCLHCANPLCVKACPVDAISKRGKDGIVLVDASKCLGKDKCDKCFKACPYDAPQFGSDVDSKMNKCDCCVDMLAENKMPYCVSHCSHKALDAGPLEELKAKYGDQQIALGFKYSKSAKPSSVMKSAQ